MVDIAIIHQFADSKLRGDMDKLYLIRHGKTDLNSENKEEDRIRGWLDIPLNEKGMKEADKAGKDLQGKGIRKIISSDMQRCRQTAEIISEYTGITPKYTHAFRPLDLGNYAGEYSLDVAPHIRYYVAHEDEAIPGGESVRQFMHRFIPAFREQLQEVEKGNGPIAVITSYRDLKAAQSWFARGMKDEEYDQDVFNADHIPTAAIMQWLWDGEKWHIGAPEAP